MFITASFASRASLAFLKQTKSNARQTGATARQGAVGTVHSDQFEGAELCRDEKGGKTESQGQEGRSINILPAPGELAPSVCRPQMQLLTSFLFCVAAGNFLLLVKCVVSFESVFLK